ncbi:DtxR family transcriptional regulator, Mn-dependent transcriptional regulator [Mariniphaga anaerophila]|uniref:DtxR family transcriptional regulator, Mn-dependent transcriptional regulator n=1 Tax=Mariniphaga anaerophila TaxID=1484053 RepID=A0A1M4WNS0_9BACT|nr:metal-dependent transcriptional regulator [Mariniphaga anaerophila]SHE82612.1 DtxR family transcriptional regulator, Mn-dependent transcriptional regulator [Mariniphaga anaerophila]
MEPFFNPIIAILLVLVAIAIIFWLLWPQKGLWAKLSKLNMNSRRVLLEDTLKFLYDCEYKGVEYKIQDLAKNLNTTKEKSEKLLKLLQTMELVSKEENTYRLNDAGRSYALRVVRMHRIWERYLADETGLNQTEWHTKADYLEHKMSDDEIDKLAAQIGNPVFDPHGDPIPTSNGELPDHKGKALSELKKGSIARIIHIEDEPVEVYQQLAAEGLYPGMQVYVLKAEKDKITFAADGQECTLIPQFAASITVEAIDKDKFTSEKPLQLSSLNIGEEAEIAGISPNFRGQQRRRLMDLGIVPGRRVAAIMQSASGDPVGYRIMGTTIGIRKSQADQIFIKNKVS